MGSEYSSSTARTARCPWLALLILLACNGCRFDKHVSGRVVDHDGGELLQGGAVSTAQTGWGISQGSLVWDETHVTRTRTDSNGEFILHYRVGNSARLAVSGSGLVWRRRPACMLLTRPAIPA